MKLHELTNLLNENGYQYEVSDINAKEFYISKGFRSNKKEQLSYIKVVTIKNPNHSQNLEFTLYKQSLNRENSKINFNLTESAKKWNT